MEWLKRLPAMGIPSYFCSSVSNISTTIVKQYIESQVGVFPRVFDKTPNISLVEVVEIGRYLESPEPNL